ncbi:MAG: hypothetical protein LBC12_00505 [Nitrososphaerota archaeon]|jgi:predicted transcriptional regulator|nr:hypothetical protein [Nitrososphaerota archaeon]
MVEVLLSIKPEYVAGILSGSKRWEFRRRIWKQKVDWVYIYSSAPAKMVVGRFKVKSIIYCSDNSLVFYDFKCLWSDTKSFAGVSEEQYFEYFKGSTSGFAIEIAKLEVFKPPVDSPRWDPWFIAPQNFRYLTKGEKEFFEACNYDNAGEC